MTIGEEMWSWANELFPICRSLTGEGVRKTLAFLNELLDRAMTLHEVPSGTPAFDWIVPKEWNIRDAWIEDPGGRRIVDFRESNLHVVGYSVPVDRKLPLEELQGHLYSLPSQPDAVPYVTSYYEERWGFCLSENRRKQLLPGDYHVRIDSTLEDGSLTYGEVRLPGESQEEVLLSTYVCHPSMANNELSGPVVTTALVRWLQSLPSRRYTYRVVYVPETIGSIVYLSRNLDALRRNVVAGFVVTCIGDERAYSYLRSPYGDTLADKVASHVLTHHCPEHREYSFLERGSDERQYCSPGLRLPMVSVMRTKYAEYDEYHTSRDDLTLVTPAGLEGGYEVMRKCLAALEANLCYEMSVHCEPQLGKRGLYPTLSTRSSGDPVREMMNLIAYSDGTNDLIDIANILGSPIWNLEDIVQKLCAAGLMREAAPSE